VPFLRFSRDKRGYENTYLVHTQNRRGKPPRTRVLYWYRTPPGVKVGRPPFDEETRHNLEAQNPDVTFDWPTIVATPFPPAAENEQWRERRRAERAAKQTQRAEEAVSGLSDQGSVPESIGATEQVDVMLAEAEAIVSVAEAGNEAETALSDAEPEPSENFQAETAYDSIQAEVLPAVEQPGEPARKRRRRGGRRRRGRRPAGSAANHAGPEGQNPGVPPESGRSSETFPDSATTESHESSDE
jgi:hypothetical protein